MNQNIWSLSIKDYFTKKMLTYAFAPFLFTLIVLYGLFFSAADAGLDSLQESFVQVQTSQTTQENGITHTENTNVIYNGGNAIVEFLMEHAITSWLVTFFVFTVGGMLMFIVAIFTAILIIGFLTPAIMKELQARHYPDIAMEGHGNALTTLFHSLKYLMVTLLLLILLVPLYFIPIVNIVAINFPFYYLFHKFYLLDAGTTVMTKEQFKQMMFFQGNRVRFNTLILYLIAMIPFAAFFTPVFNVIVLGHTLFRSRQKQLQETV